MREEQVVIEKRPVVTGELIVGKRKVQEIKRFSDTVRREMPRVEREGEVVVQDSNGEYEEGDACGVLSRHTQGDQLLQQAVGPGGPLGCTA